MATSFMLQPNITMNSLTNQYSIIQISPIKCLAKSPNFPRLITNPKMTLKCSVWGENLNKPILEPVKKETKENPYEVFANAVLKSLKTLQEATLALVLFMGVAFMSLSKNSALAAGGGRMGGSDFSSSSSSSSSWSSPSSSSSSSWSSPSSSSSSWSSPSSSSSYNYDDDYSTPSYSLSSFFRSSKLGGDVALVESVSVETAKPPLIGQPFWSPTKVIVATLGVLCVLTAIMNMLSAPTETTTFSQILKTSIGKSVLTLQVGVLGSAKSLQKELDRIAKTANTSTKAGLTYVLTETTSAVLQHIDYCISAYSSVDVKSDMKDVETLFNRSTLEERAKLDKETLVNVNNKKKQSTSSKGTPGFKNEYIVITIIVAAERVLKLPKISSSEDLKEALKIIGSITTNKTLGVEVLWAPQDENDTLTEREVLEKYPLLRSLSITL